MIVRTILAMTTAAAACVGMAHAESDGAMKIGITQNNLGVGSYQTTHEKAFIEAAAANDMVKTVRLDAGGDVARQIAQVEDLIQQEVDAIINWPTNGAAAIPAIRKARHAGIPVIVTNSNIAEQGFDFVKSFSGPENISHGARPAEIMSDKLKEMGIDGEAKVDHITVQPGHITAIERAQGLEDRLSEVCSSVQVIDTQPADATRRWQKATTGVGSTSPRSMTPRPRFRPPSTRSTARNCPS